MMKVFKFPAAAAVLTLLLAACSTPQSVVSSMPDLSNLYGQYAVSYATLHGPFPTVIHGNPFQIPKAEADAVIMSSLRLPRWFTPAEFAQRPTDAKPKGYRLVFLFNPANPIPTSAAVCGTLEDVEFARQPTRVRAVFCAGKRSISKIDGWMTATSPGDPTFQPFMNMLVASLLPARNINQFNSRCAAPLGPC